MGAARCAPSRTQLHRPTSPFWARALAIAALCLLCSCICPYAAPADRAQRLQSNSTAIGMTAYPGLGTPSLNRLADAQLLSLIATPANNTSLRSKNGNSVARAREDPCSVPKRLKKPCVQQESIVTFKDRQTSVPPARWDRLSSALYKGAIDPWVADELEPYLYDMDYVSPAMVAAAGAEGPGPQSHLWDPELRNTGSIHCEDPRDCLTAYLPDLYYAGDEYMGGWALEGFQGEGLRSAIGPNIAAGDDPRQYNYTYIPYTQRIIFAPAASLFFPYLFSIYAGQVYVAEADPTLATVAAAARAGIVTDYYYVNNYYNSYSFITWGVASSAVASAQARIRGVIGTGIKVRNFNALLATITRDDYNDRNRILLQNGIAFLGTSGGGYIFSNPVARNAFVGQLPFTSVGYYAYDYSSAANPFPIAPAVG